MSDQSVTLIAAGLDPSLSNIGASKMELTFNQEGKIVAHKLISVALSQTNPDKKKSRRKNEEDRARAVIHHEFLKDYLKDVDIVFCELPVGSQTARAMASYGICIGITAAIELPFFVVAPMDLKLAACRNKQATKEDMISWGIRKFPNANWLQGKSASVLKKNEHIADSLAAIVAGVKTEQFKQARNFILRR